MTTYLFVTDPDVHHPVTIRDKSNMWSCAKATKPGDQILVYLKGNIGISYLWQATTYAVKDRKWIYTCRVAYVSDFVPPISLQEIREVVTRDEWKPPYVNFRSFKAIRITDEVSEKILALR